MKRFLKILMIILPLLFIAPVVIMAQDGGEIPDLGGLFTSYAGFCAGVMVLTGLLTRWIDLSTLGRSILSWVVATIVGFIGYFANWGVFADIEWYYVFVYVISLALGSNILYNVNWIRDLLALLKLVKPKKALKT